MNDIDKLIQDAEQRSTEVAADDSSNLPATQQSTAVARRPSLDNLLNSGMSVDTYLKVSKHGLYVTVDNTEHLFEEIEQVTIDMSRVVSTEVVKFGNPATYIKTFDGVVSADGRTRWTDALEKAAGFGATPYASADIPMTLDTAIVDKKGNVLFDVGASIGYSLSTTNREAFASFLTDVNNDNLRHSKVRAKIGYEVKKSPDYTWGIVTFKLLGAAED